MTDKTDDNAVTPTPAEDFNGGFLEGIDDAIVDPLDFADKPVVAEVETPKVEDSPKEEPKVEEPPAEPVAATKPEPVTPAVDTAQILELLDKRLPKEPQALQPAPVPAPVVETKKEPEPEKPVLSAEETARLDELQKDWKDVTELMQLQSRVTADAIAKEVAKQVAAQVTALESKFSALEQNMKPVQESVQLSAEERYDAAVKAVHPEIYDPKQSQSFGDELVSWVKSQPAYLRDAYSQAISSTNPQDAIDLINRFKAETGKATPVAEETPPPAPTADAGDKAKKLKLMAQPTSRPTKGAESDDPLDFEGGFKEMAREIQRAG